MARRSQLPPWHLRAEQLAEEGADFITAGFPCQDISFAGNGAGLAGSRSGLVWPLLRTIRLVRPAGALLENVAALLSRGLGDILGHLATVGYDAEWHCIPASAVGAPHQRDRVWIVLTDADRQGEHDGAVDAKVGRASQSCAYSSPLLGPEIIGRQPDGNHAGAGAMAYAEGNGRLAWWAGDAPQEPRGRQPRGSSIGEVDLCNANVSGLALPERQSRDVGEELAPSVGADWWSTEPDVGRVADGVPSRVDRLRCLGNAVVPEIPYRIGKAILEAEGSR
jgi:DNA (cytosine-5)-methyltransferase 1